MGASILGFAQFPNEDFPGIGGVNCACVSVCLCVRVCVLSNILPGLNWANVKAAALSIGGLNSSLVGLRSLPRLFLRHVFFSI